MSDSSSIRADLEPGADEDLVALGERLRDCRPLPSPAFRGELGRRLAGPAARRLNPGRIRVLIAGYALAGTVLLAVGTVSAVGVGPLG